MADGRQFENPLNRHISATDWPILMKLATVMQIGPLLGTDSWNFDFFKNQDGGAAAILKNHKKNRDITATVWPIFTKFATLVQNGSLNRFK